MTLFKWTWIILAFFVGHICSYNILIMLPFGSRSHKNALDPIAEVLGQRGHQVTLMAPLAETKEMKGVKNVHLKIVEGIMSNPPSFFEMGAMDGSAFLDKMVIFTRDICNATYQEPEVQSIIKNSRNSNDERLPKYDVLVVDFGFNDHLLPLGHLMGIPVVYISTSMYYPHVIWTLNVPTPYSYVLSGIEFVDEETSMVDRAKNAFATLFLIYLVHWRIFPNFEEIIRKHIPDSPHLLDLERNISFVMANTNPAIHSARPSMPYTLEIGCVHCSPGKKLPKDLEDYLENAGPNGVVYFSLGSVTKGNMMPEDMKQKVLKAFSKLPLKVLWKYEGEIPGLPSNIRLVKWAPQQSLLAHPQLKLFISHGGGLSTQEAAYHGCPLLGFPLTGDQLGNIASAVRCGFADHLDWRTFTVEDMYEKIQLMVKDKRYRERAAEISRILQDNLHPPAEAAAYWIEYVVRHKGAPHLKSAAQQLNFFQYFLLDVIATFVAVVLITLGILVYILKRICHALRKCFSRDNKVKKQKKS